MRAIFMPYYDSEAIEQARQVDLLTYLQTCEPQELVYVSGNVYCTKTHDSLRISNGKWCWFFRGIGGYSALDYLIKVNGYSFMDAMETITGRAASTPLINRTATTAFPMCKKTATLVFPITWFCMATA